MEKYTNWQDVPENLKTRSALKKMGLRPQRNQKPAAIKTHWHWKTPDYELYEVSECHPYKLSERQRAALEQAREKSLQSRTCKSCGYVEELGAHYRNKVYVRHGLCPYCRERRRHKEDHNDAIQWAQETLQRPNVLILDSETTDLYGEIIELAIINLAGETLYNGRFKPLSAISPEATAVHGMTAESLAQEPLFSQEHETIKQLLTSAGLMLIYNAEFDVTRLWKTREIHGLEHFEFEADCLMVWYAAYVNHWSSYWKSYRWQALNGGHSALADCRAALAVLQEMAAGEVWKLD